MIQGKKAVSWRLLVCCILLGFTLASIPKEPEAAVPTLVAFGMRIVQVAAGIGIEKGGKAIFGNAWSDAKKIFVPVWDELSKIFPDLLKAGTKDAELAAKKAQMHLAESDELKNFIDSKFLSLERGQAEIMAEVGRTLKEVKHLHIKLASFEQKFDKVISSLERDRKNRSMYALDDYDILKRAFKDTKKLRLQSPLDQLWAVTTALNYKTSDLLSNAVSHKIYSLYLPGHTYYSQGWSGELTFNTEITEYTFSVSDKYKADNSSVMGSKNSSCTKFITEILGNKDCRTISLNFDTGTREGIGVFQIYDPSIFKDLPRLSFQEVLTRFYNNELWRPSPLQYCSIRGEWRSIPSLERELCTQ